MGKIVARFLITVLAFLLAAYLVPGIEVAGAYTALVLAFFWGVINLTVKPVLFVLTLPINFLSLGLFSFVLNGFLLWFLGTFVEGFTVAGFGSAILGAFVIGCVTWFGRKFVRIIA
ncbi:MAG: hypothetical protein A3D67_03225 [Candidatus Lloydbacteria bacterium RIFCSPHIGHO2_02_FULL_51_22]|uniref:Phage holin family protein n=3 Tax=Candidatus Lloydiibacteriota TaxID=1817910 RepID=A0A1G2DDM5_9BACT|nr:MAG: hypothetical protein A3D67_03225 [Candidatus Lloydbacteria bacterium RIFCSPHIGHO2_02_FULL_51_22]OGZ15683.1 MAG: hypothetical protein A3J08_01370 [Candidatus Lloydbacteria bacterium RIFCSPLOWO2_02_FULL_51_11]OGZ15914.1 MAG: hypothetical protein A3G11_02370 [Candidatus Lloydbacteria bacterium RIFCSPLOWO2_12_FULL_51_9]